MRQILFVLALAAALPAAAQQPPASTVPPPAHGVDANDAAEDAVRIDAALDAEREAAVDRPVSEDDAPTPPPRVGRVAVQPVEAAEPPVDPAQADADGDGIPDRDDDDSAGEREEQ